MAIKLDNTKFVKSLVNGYKLAPHIDRVIGEGEFDWTATFGAKHGDDAFHPSGDCLPSPHTLYAKAKGQVGRPPSISLRKTFTVGHFWHAYVQHIVVERLGFSTWGEIERLHEMRWAEGAFGWARGSADIAPCHLPKQGDWLVDIKTMGAHDFRQHTLPDWCAAKYEAQVNVYMSWFDLDRTIILCVAKDSPHDFKEFVFERNQPLIDAIFSKWKLVKECLDQGVEPPDDFDTHLPLVGPKL